MNTRTLRQSPLFRFIAFIVLIAFAGMLPVSPSYAQVSIMMPPAGQMMHVTRHFEPPQMVGLKVNLKDPFSFDFIMDQGENSMPDDDRNQEFNKIIKYFLVSLAMPNKEMWVNLSPYESHRIIPEVFGQTEMGRDLLAQDYILKQFTASLMYPENELGKEFWNKVYQEAQVRFGTTNINVNTFNKVWIVADKADIYQKGDTAFLVDSHLKVMLEQDFMAIDKNNEQFGNAQALEDINKDAKTKMASEIVRQIIIPAIEKEVNDGKSFAGVRQVYNAEIMATWFKRTLKQSLLGQVFADKSKVLGQRSSDPQADEKIYKQYLKAYKKGVFNYIREDATPDGQIIPRKYFSGGLVPLDEEGGNVLRNITPAMIESSPASKAMVAGAIGKLVRRHARVLLVTAAFSALAASASATPGIHHSSIFFTPATSTSIQLQQAQTPAQQAPQAFHKQHRVHKYTVHHILKKAFLQALDAGALHRDDSTGQITGNVGAKLQMTAGHHVWEWDGSKFEADGKEVVIILNKNGKIKYYFKDQNNVEETAEATAVSNAFDAVKKDTDTQTPTQNDQEEMRVLEADIASELPSSPEVADLNIQAQEAQAAEKAAEKTQEEAAAADLSAKQAADAVAQQQQADEKAAKALTNARATVNAPRAKKASHKRASKYKNQTKAVKTAKTPNTTTAKTITPTVKTVNPTATKSRKKLSDRSAKWAAITAQKAAEKSKKIADAKAAAIAKSEADLKAAQEAKATADKKLADAKAAQDQKDAEELAAKKAAARARLIAEVKRYTLDATLLYLAIGVITGGYVVSITKMKALREKIRSLKNDLIINFKDLGNNPRIVELQGLISNFRLGLRTAKEELPASPELEATIASKQETAAEESKIEKAQKYLQAKIDLTIKSSKKLLAKYRSTPNAIVPEEIVVEQEADLLKTEEEIAEISASPIAPIAAQETAPQVIVRERFNKNLQKTIALLIYRLKANFEKFKNDPRVTAIQDYFRSQKVALITAEEKISAPPVSAISLEELQVSDINARYLIDAKIKEELQKRPETADVIRATDLMDYWAHLYDGLDAVAVENVDLVKKLGFYYDQDAHEFVNNDSSRNLTKVDIAREIIDNLPPGENYEPFKGLLETWSTLEPLLISLGIVLPAQQTAAVETFQELNAEKVYVETPSETFSVAEAPVANRNLFAFKTDSTSIDPVKHKENQDSYLVDQGLGLVVVADGVGGAAMGQEASRLAVETIKNLITKNALEGITNLDDLKVFLRNVIVKINQSMANYINLNPKAAGMATTFSMGLIWKDPSANKDKLIVVNKGDSRVYLRRSNGQVEQLSVDDSPIKIKKTRDSAGYGYSPKQSEIVGGILANITGDSLNGKDANGNLSDHQLKDFDLEAGDTVFVMSDGLSDNLGDEITKRIISDGDDPNSVVDNLVEGAKKISLLPKGIIKESELSEIQGVDAHALYAYLTTDGVGYMDKDGKVDRDKFEKLWDYSDMVLPSEFNNHKEEIYEILHRSLRVKPDDLTGVGLQVDKAQNVGGINLSDEHLTINIKVDGAGMPLPAQYQDAAMLDLNGLTSIIRKITPISPENVPALYESIGQS